MHNQRLLRMAMERVLAAVPHQEKDPRFAARTKKKEAQILPN